MKDEVINAAQAHTNLNTFATVVTILEGGHLYTSRANRVADRIIKLCKEAQHRELLAFDRAMEKLL